MGRTGGWIAIAPLLCVLALTPSQRGVSDAEQDGSATPTAYGDCGPGARPETALQGQVPLADQRSGRSALGYQCNMRRVGRNDVGPRGNNFQLAWYRDCAYVSTIGLQAQTGAAGEPDPSLDGIAVIDVADPRAPKLADVVKSDLVAEDSSAKSSHEAIEVNERRGLLVTAIGGTVARYIEVYDVRGDCRHPRYLGRYDAGRPMFHGMRVADDGRTVYATDTFRASAAGQVMHVVDITDPRHPRRLLTWDPTEGTPRDVYAVHDLDVSADGSRAYLGTAPYQAAVGNAVAGPPSVGPGTSLAILDTSGIQARRADVTPKVVSTLSLPNLGHTVQRIRVGGKPYLLVSGEAPIGGPQKCPWAWGHIVDVSDERHPRRVSDLRLEVDRTSNCPATGEDGGANYSIHYVGVDSERDTRLVFFTYYNSGVRVFDVHDPLHPKEVAYYNPPATLGTKFPSLSPLTPDSGSSVFDYTTSVVRYRPETGALWVVSVNGGFQVLQLTGAPGRPHATLDLLPVRRRATHVLARVHCERPCRMTVELSGAGRRAGARTVALALRETRTVSLRLGRRARSRALVKATATVADPLTGEPRQHVSTETRSR